MSIQTTERPVSRLANALSKARAYHASQPRLLKLLFWFNIGIAAVCLLGSAIVLFYHDVATVATMLTALPFILLSLFIAKRGRVESAFIYLAFCMLFLITLISTRNLGIHHISNYGLPGILIVSSLVAKRRTMIVLTLAIILCVAWLVFGEIAGLYTPSVLKHSVAGDFYTTSIIMVLIAFMARSVSESMFRSNKELKGELTERRRVEGELSENIARRAESERLLRSALDEKTELLREKDLLLKEMHHRVKNNMQVVSSILSLQAEGVDDPAMYSILQDSQNRMHSIALVHEQLYLSKSLSHVEMRSYVEELACMIGDSYKRSPGNVRFRYEIEGLKLGIDQALPCGLILTELISNALKHAFREDSRGSIEIGLGEGEASTIRLYVEDDGIGISPGEGWLHTGSLGMQLVRSLSQQLRGTLELARLSPGSRFSIAFPRLASSRADPLLD
ncbi:MAG TPA: histidine kinase dimerization/phosphoacceptor domain -containing protein [Rectinemataceae bacterium]|nr:histidine kinase dimerization/phosphoacceptor domain -containing protein [Rectinemataceae bacterium]